MSEYPADDEQKLGTEGDNLSSPGLNDASKAGQANAEPASLVAPASNMSRSSRPPAPLSHPPRPRPSGPPRAQMSRPPLGSSTTSSAEAPPNVEVPPIVASAPPTSHGEPIIARRVIKLEESGRREFSPPPPRRSSGSTPAIETSESNFDLEEELDDAELQALASIPKAPAIPTIEHLAVREHDERRGMGETARFESELHQGSAEAFELAATSAAITDFEVTPLPSSSELYQELSPVSGSAFEAPMPSPEFVPVASSGISAARNSTPDALAGAYAVPDFEEDIHLETDEPPDVESSPDSEPAEPLDDVEAMDVLSLQPSQKSASSAPAMPDIPAVERKPPPPRRSAKPSLPRVTQQRKKPWWETLFGDDFSRAYRPMTERQLRREVDFITEQLALPKGAVILDLGCGQGEICVELARRGYSVVGYDLSVYQLAMAGDHAQAAKQKINFLQGDMREMAFEQMFDAVICWDTSFGYFEEEKNVDVLQRIRSSLKPGGRFLLDVMNRDFAACEAPYNHWFEGDGCVCMDDMVMDWITNRLKVKRSIILDDGRSKELQYSVRLYGLSEVGRMLHDVGFRVASVSGDVATKGAFFGPHSRRIIIQSTAP